MNDAVALPTTEGRNIDWDRFEKALGGVPCVRQESMVRQKSRDFFWYSPILKEKLAGRTGDILVQPRNVEDVLTVARVCVNERIPITVRGAGTGNYGQAMPLCGGVVLEMTRLDRILWRNHDVLRVESGKKLLDIDAETMPDGWELRMHPSTKRNATIGGFIAGGSGGVGSITYGGLRERGNVRALKLVTMEDEPRLVELRGDEVQKANHAYGTNGIIVECEVPLGPTYPWADVIVTFDDFMRSCHFAQALGRHDGLVKKLITPMAWPIPSYFRPLRKILPEGRHVVFCMIAETSLEPFADLLAEFGGEVCYQRGAEEVARTTPLYEYTWNHTTLHALRVDKAMTYLQARFPLGRNVEMIEHMVDHFGDEVLMHAEWVRWDGIVTNTALPLVRYTTEERLNEIIRYHEENGVGIANPHTFILEDGGMKVIDADQLGFKMQADPQGLLNPGKMRGWAEAKARGIESAVELAEQRWF